MEIFIYSVWPYMEEIDFLIWIVINKTAEIVGGRGFRTRRNENYKTFRIDLTNSIENDIVIKN